MIVNVFFAAAAADSVLHAVELLLGRVRVARDTRATAIPPLVPESPESGRIAETGRGR